MVLKTERYDIQKTIIDALNANLTEKMFHTSNDASLLNKNDYVKYYFITGGWVYEVINLNNGSKAFSVIRCNKIYDTFTHQTYSLTYESDKPTIEEYYVEHINYCGTLKKYVEPYNNYRAKRESVKHSKKLIIKAKDVKHLMGHLKPDKSDNKSDYELFLELFNKTPELDITNETISEEQFIKLNTPLSIDGTEDFYDNIFYFTQNRTTGDYVCAFLLVFNCKNHTTDKRLTKLFFIRSSYYTDITGKVIYTDGRHLQHISEIYKHQVGNKMELIPRANDKPIDFFNITNDASYDVLTNRFNKTFQYRATTASHKHSNRHDLNQNDNMRIDRILYNKHHICIESKCSNLCMYS